MARQFLPGLSVSGPLPAEIVVVPYGDDEYVLDVVALTSNYNCIYGRGCQGTTPFEGEGPGQHRPVDPSVTGCCRTAPGYTLSTDEVSDADAATLDSPRRVQQFVTQLRPDEAQHHERIAAGDWFEENPDEANWFSRHTRVAGNCIFLNTEMANGKTGCSLYHLAARLGIDAKETRPFVCHSAPAAVFTIGDTNDRAGARLLVTLRPAWFGWYAPEGYFCTSDPAAFSASEPVFHRMASEYSMLLGADVYDALRPVLDQAWAERGERLRRSWGKPVALAMPEWAQDHVADRRKAAAAAALAPASTPAEGGNTAAGDGRE